MDNTDTVLLLRECDAGTKMAVSSIDEVLDKVVDPRVRALLEKSKHDHSEIGNQLHSLLIEHDSEEKEPNPMAKGMSWIKTNWKMGMGESDATVADLITDGCNMGVKSLCRYENQYKAADQKSKTICKQLVKIEEMLATELRPYL